jgi:hypothetical protein
MSGHSLGTYSLARSLLQTAHPVEGEFRLVRETLKVSKKGIDPIQPNPNKEEGNQPSDIS